MDSAIQALNNQGLVISLLKCVLGGQNGLILSGLTYHKLQYKLKNEMLLHEIIWDDVHENKKYCRSMTSCTCKTECNLQKRMCRENNNLQSSIFPCYCNSENHINTKIFWYLSYNVTWIAAFWLIDGFIIDKVLFHQYAKQKDPIFPCVHWLINHRRCLKD